MYIPDANLSFLLLIPFQYILFPLTSLSTLFLSNFFNNFPLISYISIFKSSISIGKFPIITFLISFILHGLGYIIIFSSSVPSFSDSNNQYIQKWSVSKFTVLFVVSYHTFFIFSHYTFLSFK